MKREHFNRRPRTPHGRLRWLLLAVLAIAFLGLLRVGASLSESDDAGPNEAPRGLSNAGKSTVAGPGGGVDSSQLALVVRSRSELTEVVPPRENDYSDPLAAVHRAREDPLDVLRKAGAAGQVGQPAVKLPDATRILIVSTLDGQLHGIDKTAGKLLWSTSAGGEGIISSGAGQFGARGPNGQGTSSPTKDSAPKDDEEDDDGDLWADDGIDNDMIYSGDEKPDVVYIAEPMSGGNLYVYQNGRAMQKLPLPIRDLVSLSPFRSSDGTIYIGRKTTRFLALEPYTGKVVGDYGGPDADADVCSSMNGGLGGKSNGECDPTEEAVYVGRTDYHLSIFSPPSSGHPTARFNITYAEYSATSLDDLSLLLTPQQLYSRDPLHVIPSADGGVVLENGKSGLKKTIRMRTPVVGGFNMFEMEPTANSAVRGRYHLHRVFPGQLSADSSKVPVLAHAFIGSHNGSLYALSSSHFAPEVGVSDDKIPADGALAGDDDVPSSSNSLSSIAPDGSVIGCIPSADDYPACLAGLRLPVLDPPPLIQPALPPSNTSQNSGKPGVSVTEPASVTYSYGYSILRTLWIGTGLLLVFALGAGALYLYTQYQPLGARVTEAPLVSVNARRKRGARGSGKGNNKEQKENSSNKDSMAADTAEGGDTEPDTPTDGSPTRSNTGDSMDASVGKEPVAPSKEGDSPVDGESANGVATPKTKRKRKPHAAKRKDSADMSRSTSKENLVTLQPLDPAADKPLPTLPGLPESASPKMIQVTPQILGYGSHGTVVYKGAFQGRECAVKRLLLDFYDVADHEVNILRESDDHPNVVRYFAKEQCDRFMYIALELCPASIFDIVERATVPEFKLLRDQLSPPQVVYQMMSGIAYLHNLKVVHRDIKPQNILITQGKPKQPPRIVISDFGLGKKLEDNQSSFNNTLHTAAGTVGWRAPECMPHPSNMSDSGAAADGAAGESHSSSKEFGVMGVRITKAVDIFSAGCVFYYIVSNGEHPFGDRYEREVNILRGNFRIDKLAGMGEEGIEAMDLISAMIARDFKARPSATDVLVHPYFWSPAQRLNFLADASDRFEIEVRDPPSTVLQKLEAGSNKIIGGDWHRRLDRSVIDNLGKHRKYDGALIRDLLRGLRNKKHHYQDLPEPVKRQLGPLPEGFLSYFTNRFPNLLLHVYRVIADDEHLREERIFKPFFETSKNRFT